MKITATHTEFKKLALCTECCNFQLCMFNLITNRDIECGCLEDEECILLDIEIDESHTVHSLEKGDEVYVYDINLRELAIGTVSQIGERILYAIAKLGGECVSMSFRKDTNKSDNYLSCGNNIKLFASESDFEEWREHNG